MKASGITVEWYEGVAIVQEASRRLLESPPPNQPGSALSLATVRIDRTGHVFVSGYGIRDGCSAVSQLGALLRDLLPDNLPVPLRLAVSQAMSNPPHYASIESFSQELSYFERPDRAGIVRHLYQRWDTHADPPRAAGSHVTPQDERPPVAQEPAPQHPGTAASGKRRVVVWGVGMAITLGSVLSAVLVPVPGGRFTVDEVYSAIGLSAPRSEAPADAAAVESPKPVASPVRDVARPGTTIQTARPIQHTQLESRRVPAKPVAAPVTFSTLSGALESPRPTPAPRAVANPLAGSNAVAESATGSRIYSALDTDVAAPVAAYPQSATVTTVFHDDEMLTFDLVIDESGKVESVKLRRAPSSIRSALMLTMSMSVAKAWRFQPAMRHGQSVKYRQSVSVPAPQ